MADEKTSNEEIGQALADGLGLDTSGPSPRREVDEFFESVKKSSTADLLPDQPSEGNIAVSEQSFVHEPTGKVFNTENEYLKYNNGYDVQRLGERATAAELALAELKGRVESGTQPHKAPSKMDLKRQLWPNASEESLNDYASDFILEGVENAVGVVMQGTQAELAKRDELIARLSSQLEETAARANSGVDAAVEQRILQKHPGLAALPVAQRMAMVKDLAGVTPANAGPGKLLNRISTAGNPADHVEGSALSTPHSSDEALMEEFDKVDNSKKELSILGKLVAQNGSFAGYNPTGY